MDLKIVLKKALSTSIVSKIFGLWSSIYVVSVAAKILGNDEFAAFLLLSSLGGWLNLLSSGVSPLISSTLLKTGVSGESRSSVNSSFLFVFICLITINFIFYTFYHFGFFDDVSELSNYKATSITILLFSLTLLFSLGDSIRIGFHQTHIVNICFAAIGILVLLLFFYIRKMPEERLEYLMIALLLPSVLVKLINLIMSLKKIDWFKSKQKFTFDLNSFSLIISTSFSFIIIQAAGLISVQLLLFLLSFNGETQLLNEFGVLFRFFALSGSFLTMISVPLWPILLEKISRNEIDTVVQVIRKTKLAFIGYGFLIMLFISFFGGLLFEYWTNGKVMFTYVEVILIGLRVILLCYSQAQVLILRAFEKYSFMGKTLLAQSVLELSFSLFLIKLHLNYFSLLVLVHLFFAFFSIFIMGKKIGKLTL